MSTADEIAAAFERVDGLLVAAKETAPSVALLLDRAAANGIPEKTLAANLQTNLTVLGWILMVPGKVPIIRDGFEPM